LGVDLNHRESNSKSEIIIRQAKGEKTALEANLRHETVWLSCERYTFKVWFQFLLEIRNW